MRALHHPTAHIHRFGILAYAAQKFGGKGTSCDRATRARRPRDQPGVRHGRGIGGCPMQDSDGLVLTYDVRPHAHGVTPTRAATSSRI